VNALVRSLLEDAVGLDARRARLRRYATWDAGDLEAFDRAIAAQRVIDDDLWQ